MTNTSNQPIIHDPKIPGLPVPSFRPETAWILWYRQGQNVHSQFKIVNCEGSIQDVIKRLKRHCDNMNYRFVRGQQFCSNMDKDEQGALEGGENV